MLNVYGIANCDSVSAARRWLKEHGIAHEFHDLRKEHVDAQTLEQWLAALGRERLVNKSSATWRTLERSQREILEMTSGNWLSFREFNGLMVYYTHLLSYRCAIREVKIGIDTTVPDKKLALPPCNPADPSSHPEKSVSYMKLPAGTKLMSIELTYKDGSVSETKTYRADPRTNR